MSDFEPNLMIVLVAALAGFGVGGLWYSPLLIGELWMKEAGITQEQIDAGNKAQTFGLAFVSLLIMSYLLALFIGSTVELGDGFFSPSQQGAYHGFIVGLGWVFFAFVVVGRFEQRSWKYIGINGGYWVVTLTTMGGLLGGMQ